MLWTLILSFTVAGYTHSHVPSSHSVVVPNLPFKEICEKTGADHIKKFNSNRYAYYVGVYTCVEQGK